MQVELKVDPACTELKIIVLTDRMTDEVSAIVKKLSDDIPQILSGFRDDTLEILEQDNIYRFYASAGKVLAETNTGEYTLRLRLFELEDRLDKSRFVRISNSEIINIRKVRKFDLKFTGTICVCLSNGVVTYVSRRYVHKIKQVLGI